MKKTVKLLVAVGMSLSFMLPIGVNAYQWSKTLLILVGTFQGMLPMN